MTNKYREENKFSKKSICEEEEKVRKQIVTTKYVKKKKCKTEHMGKEWYSEKKKKITNFV